MALLLFNKAVEGCSDCAAPVTIGLLHVKRAITARFVSEVTRTWYPEKGSRCTLTKYSYKFSKQMNKLGEFGDNPELN
jgi:hypothetical protein